jgi:hypothetical protein
MKSLFIILLMAILSFIGILILPWWSPIVLAFCLILIMPLSPGKAFWNTFLGTFICYLAYVIIIDIRNEQLLSSKMATLFHIPYSTLMLIITSLVGGITAGLGGLLAAFIKPIKATTTESSSIDQHNLV